MEWLKKKSHLLTTRWNGLENHPLEKYLFILERRFRVDIFIQAEREHIEKPIQLVRDTFKMIAISFRLSANVIADGKFFARWFHFCSLRYRHRHDGKRRSETNRAKTERKSERKSNELVNWSIFTLITIDKSMQREWKSERETAM